jgi:hypothetical protein
MSQSTVLGLCPHFCFQGVSPVLSAGLIIAQMIVYYYIDFFKENHSRKMKLASQDAAFWRAFIGDQTLHQFTVSRWPRLSFSGRERLNWITVELMHCRSVEPALSGVRNSVCAIYELRHLSLQSGSCMPHITLSTRFMTRTRVIWR